MDVASQGPDAGGQEPVLVLPEVEVEGVFIVDDDELVLRSVERFLGMMGYAPRAFTDPTQALVEIERDPPKVLVTDLDMPGMTGLQLTEAARLHWPDLRVILMTGAGDEKIVQSGLRLGLTDYLIKPLELKDLGRAVQKALLAVVADEYAMAMDQWMRDEVRRQTARANDLAVASLEVLVNALDARSPYFKGHSQSVAVCAAGIARELGLDDGLVKRIRTAGLVHDIGVIGISDALIDKPGELDEAEYRIIRSHCQKGAEILSPMADLGDVVTFVLEHHERLDGSGYPHGKAGDEISLGGQIVALSESWTALTERRAFRDSMSKGEAMAALRASEGMWFSRELLEALRSSEI